MNQRNGTPSSGIDPKDYTVDGYEDFRRRAVDPRLSLHQKSGFPDLYREGKAGVILADIINKLAVLQERGKAVLDIGPGSSSLPHGLIDLCAELGHKLVLADSAEMLSLLPDAPHTHKIPGPFPGNITAIQAVEPTYDAILVYSVIQYVFREGNLWGFVDAAASLLKPGGALLLGDIPNISMRNRFLASAAGHEHHRRHVDPASEPRVEFNRPVIGEIDDSVILGLLMRLRLAGFDAFVLPQNPGLPQSNRREDILIRRA